MMSDTNENVATVHFSNKYGNWYYLYTVQIQCWQHQHVQFFSSSSVTVYDIISTTFENQHGWEFFQNHDFTLSCLRVTQLKKGCSGSGSACLSSVAGRQSRIGSGEGKTQAKTTFCLTKAEYKYQAKLK